MKTVLKISLMLNASWLIFFIICILQEYYKVALITTGVLIFIEWCGHDISNYIMIKMKGK